MRFIFNYSCLNVTLKKFFIILFLLFDLSCFQAESQIPNPIPPSINRLSKKFVKKYDNDSLRAVAICKWTTKYMRYDLKSFEKYKFKVNNYSSKRNLYRRKALCYGIANLYKEICEGAGIEAQLITGYPLENPDNPYIHYYYNSHIWVAVKINNRWWLLDPTYDLGFVRMKRRRFFFIYKILGKPSLYSRSKFKHLPTEKFLFKDGQTFMTTHYPILINAQLTDTKVEIDSFKAQSYSIGSGYNTLLDSSLVSLNKFSTYDKHYQLKIEAEQSPYSNPKNNWIKSVNYANYVMVNSHDVNKSDLDTILKYSPLFLKDNRKLHNINKSRLKIENNKLQGQWRKVYRHNNSNRRTYITTFKGSKGKIRTTALVNKRNEIKTHKAYQKATETPNKLRKIDSAGFSQIVSHYQSIEHQCDSLRENIKSKFSALNELQSLENQLFIETYNLYALRRQLMKAIKVQELQLSSYSTLNASYDKVEVLTKQIDSTTKLLQRATKQHLSMKRKTISVASKGFNSSKGMFNRIKTVYYPESQPELKSITDACLNTTVEFKNYLIRAYHSDEQLYHTQRTHYKALKKLLRKEGKAIRHASVAREGAYGNKLKYETNRYKGYNRICTKILNNAKTLKKDLRTNL
ncbi:transglutaminase domain-containing protein [Cytophagaceae bacterium ABcell3]|nr:transglutaminase domain-containing protein [Cytophagaceae bacterium ABcell3]